MRDSDVQALADFVQTAINSHTPICPMAGKELTIQQRQPVRGWAKMNMHQFHCQVCRARWILGKTRYFNPERFPREP